MLIVFFAGVLLLGIASWVAPLCGADASRGQGRTPPFEWPTFALRDQDDRPFAKQDLAGQVWIADFIDVECGQTCSLLTRSLSELKRNSAGARLVTFSVNRDDGPRALSRFTKSFPEFDGTTWRLLAADGESFPRLAVDVGLAHSLEQMAKGYLAFSTKLFLVDRKGWVRGVYDGLRQEELHRLQRDLAALEREVVVSEQR